jgi:hypothetical protein
LCLLGKCSTISPLPCTFAFSLLFRKGLALLLPRLDSYLYLPSSNQGITGMYNHTYHYTWPYLCFLYKISIYSLSMCNGYYKYKIRLLGKDFSKNGVRTLTNPIP